MVREALHNNNIMCERSHGAMIHGCVRVQLADVHHLMRRLSPAEREQLRFWQHTLGDDRGEIDLEGSAFLFEVLHARCLPSASEVQHYSTRRSRGLVTSLEDGQAPRLIEALGELPSWFGDGDVTTCVRLPEPFCHLILSGAWTSFLLPQGSGSAPQCDWANAVRFSWELLGRPRLPIVPPRFGGDNSADGDVCIDAEMLVYMADVARELAGGIDTASTEGRAQHAKLENVIRAMELAWKQTDAISFQKSVREMRGVALERVSGKTTPYKVSFLVKAMLFANVLRNSQDMRVALECSVNIILPACLRPLFRRFLDEAVTITPHKSTISRWRLLLDGAAMLVERRQNQESMKMSADVSGMARYLMIDSSMQHNRDYEHILMRRVPRRLLFDLYQFSTDLIELWSLGWPLAFPRHFAAPCLHISFPSHK